MRLLIDVGNSRLKWSLSADGGTSLMQPSRSIKWRDRVIAEQLDAEWKTLQDIRSVWLANVAGDAVTQIVQSWLQQHWRLDPHIVMSQASQLGVSNAYSEYQRLGVDRWLALLASHELLPGQDVCIIDCGTAITVDVLRRDGAHLGGMILPGPELMLQSLTSRTRVLGTSGMEPLDTMDIDSGLILSVDELVHLPAFGTSTEECIRYGISHCGRVFMEHVLELTNTTLGRDSQIVFTGGYAARYMSYVNAEVKHLPDLVLQGLSLVAGEVT